MFTGSALADKTLKLKLCFAAFAFALLTGGCASSDPTPAFEVTPSGNVWITTLPKGTTIGVKDPKVLSASFNEIKDGVLVDECSLVSKSYLIERDERELQLLQVIEEQKIK